MKNLFRDTRGFFLLSLLFCIVSGEYRLLLAGLLFFAALRTGRLEAQDMWGKVKTLFCLLFGLFVAETIASALNVGAGYATYFSLGASFGQPLVIVAALIQAILWCAVCLIFQKRLHITKRDVFRVFMDVLGIAAAAGVLRYLLSLAYQSYAPALPKLSTILTLIPNQNRPSLPAILIDFLLGIAFLVITLVEFYLFTLLLFGRAREETEGERFK